MIRPSIGRKVWFWPNSYEFNEAKLMGFEGSAPQPEDACVVYVHSDRCVNLRVSNHVGETRAETSAFLLQEGDPVPQHGGFATWMPFQVGQARAQLPPSVPAIPV